MASRDVASATEASEAFRIVDAPIDGDGFLVVAVCATTMIERGVARRGEAVSDVGW